MQEQDHLADDLDELIEIINNRTANSAGDNIRSQQGKLVNEQKRYLPPLQQKLKLETTIASLIPKYLTFKPWSGECSESQTLICLNNEPIKQQIQNQNDEDAHYEGQKQDYMRESRSYMNSIANNNQIGYFYRFQTGKVRLIKYLLDQNGFKECNMNNKNWTLYWSSSPFKMQTYRSLLPYQKVNHFPNSFHLTRKDLMNKTVSKMQLKFGITHINFLPKTYILPLEIDLLLAEYNKHPTTYIVKPHNRSQGKGITVTNSLEVIYEKLSKFSSLIVSHYIDNPLLINKLKFDLRIYVAITGINPLRIYVYEDGLARFATEQYDSSGYDSENKRYQHLTNYSVNKKNTDYVSSNNENEEYYGSKWSLIAMRDFLNYNIGRSQTNDLFDRIDDVIVKTIISGQNLLFTSFQNNVSYINGCFQVLGFDIMIDSNLKPWLIQVNHSASMNTDSALDLKIKGNMIADLFTLSGVTPLGERYLDGGHSKYQSRHYFGEERRGNQAAIDKFILKEVELQNQRRGGWRRAFPTIKNIKYKQYFQIDRYFNKLLREKFLSQESTPLEINLKNQNRSNTLGKQITQSQSQNQNLKPGPNIRFSNKKRIQLNRGSIQKAVV